ncbi:MAG: OmpA family protein [Saprospiraceae bacterium]|nr:OmpA family protein [Saprospiraceae bacterium]MCB9342984.1 OmpA family protein [Lewinellaceae bacterium]
MKTFIPILFISFASLCPLPAQNLVMNPSFEELSPNAIVVACEFTQYSTFFGERLRLWNTFDGMTPDLLQAAENCPWLTEVHSGQQCIGLIMYLPASDLEEREDYHERVRGRLKEPLKPGSRYRLSCWVREDSSIIQQHLAAVYTDKTPIVPTKSGNLGFYFYVNNPLDGQKPQVNYATPIATFGNWIQLSMEFVPEEPFQYFIMGNFYPDRLTQTNLSEEQVRDVEMKNGKIGNKVDKIKRASYLCIDDVSVELLPPSAAGLERALLREKKFTLSGEVLFETAKAELHDEAGVQLDSLVDFLINHPDLRIGISGHTDDVGTDEYNLDLSERRARAVKQYLIDHGVGADRLRSKGFGESRPVADNRTELGRKANRRVECVVLKSK